MRLLFCSGSQGLGHVTRDLALVGEIRLLLPGVQVDWLAAPPALQVLEDSGERVLAQASQLASLSHEAEAAAHAGRLNLVHYLARAKSKWRLNVELVRQALAAGPYDCLIGDETYEIAGARGRGRIPLHVPFVMIYDFVGLEAASRNPLEWLAVWSAVRKWTRLFSADLSLFVGELEDIPDEPFGFLLPNRRESARSHYCVVGHVLSFAPEALANRAGLRRELGFAPGPLIVCSIGGTSVGKELLDLCVAAWPAIRQRNPAAQMVLACGPRLDPGGVSRSGNGITVLGYVPQLFRLFAASDLAIVQAGGTTTLELTALRRPFLYFPIEGHCEQEGSVSRRLERHHAGERLTLSKTTPEQLAERVLARMGREMVCEPVPVNGARLGAEAIARLLCGRSSCPANPAPQ